MKSENEIANDDRLRPQADETQSELLKWLEDTWTESFPKPVLELMLGEAEKKLNHLQSIEIGMFCKRHDLCPMCCTGGYECGSDHK